MSTTMSATPGVLPAIEPVRLPDGPIIVGTDTSPESDAAFPLAEALATRAKAEIQAVSIVEPANVPIYGVDGMVVSLESVEETESARESSPTPARNRTR